MSIIGKKIWEMLKSIMCKFWNIRDSGLWLTLGESSINSMNYIMLLNYQLFFPEILFILTHYSQNKAPYYITNLYSYILCLK